MNTKSYLTPTKKYKTITSSLHTVYRLINSTFEIKEFLIKLAKLLCQLLKADSANIVIFDQNKNYSAYRATFNNRFSKLSEKKILIKNRLEKRIIKKGSVLMIKSLIAIPLIADDTVGMIILKKKGTYFNDFDKELIMTLAGQIVMAIKNLELYGEQQKIIAGAIKSILTLLGNQFPHSNIHSNCFLKIIEEIANRMHLEEEDRQSLKYASMLHDMGKINIPYEIVTKQSTLTGEEYKVIKQHPIKSVQIIRHLKILKPTIPIILHHHERFDGTGYPSQLKGEQIPIGARIMTVADAFDAMIFGRPYRKKISIESAMEEIKKNSGSQFDPKVVNEFLKATLTKKIKKILRKI